MLQKSLRTGQGMWKASRGPGKFLTQCSYIRSCGCWAPLTCWPTVSAEIVRDDHHREVGDSGQLSARATTSQVAACHAGRSLRGKDGKRRGAVAAQRRPARGVGKR